MINAEKVSGDRCDELSVRIVSVDHYLCEPITQFDANYSDFRQSSTNRVPVIRIFGPTNQGVKACVHVHGVYPYLSAPFHDFDDDWNQTKRLAYLRKFATDLDNQLMPSRVQTRKRLSKECATHQQVFKIEELDAIPFYGYHKNVEKFMRIYFYNPSMVQTASEQLVNGFIMNRSIQPYESHIPYILQFFIDNNLYGMNFIKMKNIRYRKTREQLDNVVYSNIEPISSCDIECDISFEDIVNQIESQQKRNPGLQAIWNEQMSRCKDSQEIRNLNGVVSQERTSNDIFTAEMFYVERLNQALLTLNINIDDNIATISQSSNYSNSDEFAKMMVQCIQANNDIDSDDSDDSISREMSQKLEDIIDVLKPGKYSKKSSSHESSDHDSDSTVIEEFDDINGNQNTSYLADVGTQTEIRCNLDDSIDSLLSYVNDNNNQNDNEEEEVEEIICDCDSDECCDHCCDRRSDQCECDCERCEYDKVKRIPQLDGAYDEDESDVQSAFNDDSNDSDFEVSSKKKSPPKKKAPVKRPTKSKRVTPVKRKKYEQNSDSSDMEFTNNSSSFIISKPGPASSKRKPEATTSSFSITSISPNDDFDSKANKISSKLFDKIKSTDVVSKKNESESPIHMSFSDSEASNVSEDKSDVEPSFMSITTNTRKSRTRKPLPPKAQKSPKTPESRSDRSVTPYFSNESDAEESTKPGPKSSKNGASTARPGPKSSKPSNISKPGPKSSKAASTGPKPGPKSSKSRPGPKSSKSETAKPAPKSSKRAYDETSESEVLSDPHVSAVTTRTRRSTKLDDSSTPMFSLDFLSDIGKAKPVKRKTSPIRTESIANKDSSFLSDEKNVPPIKRATYRRSLSFQSDVNNDSSNLEWKSFDDYCVKLDTNYYTDEDLKFIGSEQLICKKMTENVTNKHVDNYWQHTDYFNDVKSEIKAQNPNLLISGYNSKTANRLSKTRSKGELKDFYTLPHLNKDDKHAKVQKSAPKSTARKSYSNEVERLLSDSHIERGSRSSSARRSTSTTTQPPAKRTSVTNARSQAVRSIPKVTPKSVKKKYPNLPKKNLPTRAKRVSDSAVSASKSERVTRKKTPQRNEERMRPSRGVTSSTLFTTTSIAFLESDIYVVTDLQGSQKLEFLKSLCDNCDVHIFSSQLENDFVHDFMSTRPKYKEYYYNHYNGYLSDDESDFADDIKKTVRNLVNTVVSAEFALESALNKIDEQLQDEENVVEMVDTREDEFSHEESDVPDQWNYGHYADDENDEGINEVEDIGIEDCERAVDGESENDNAVTDEVPINDDIDCNQTDQQHEQHIEQNSDCEQTGKGCDDDIDESDERDMNSDKEDSNECGAEKNVIYYENSDEQQQSDVCETYDIGTQAASEEFSPSSSHSEQYSNNVNNGDNIYADEYNEQNSSLPHEVASEIHYANDEEEEEYGDCASSQSGQQNNMPIDMSNITITASHPELHSISSQETQFKLDSNYNPELYSSVNYHITSSSQSYHQPIQNIAPVAPTIPTIMSPIMTSHYAPQTVYPQQTPNWPQSMQMNVNVVPINELSYNIAPNIPNVGNNSAMTSQPQEAEFDVANFSYDMYHYPNHNIPQFDGIFDDDSFNSEGNHFNINQQSFNIEPLSQGSRSEEAAANASKLSNHQQKDSLESGKNERYGKIINGVVVYIPKSIPDAMLRKIGREMIALDRVETCEEKPTRHYYRHKHYDYSNSCYFSENDAQLFYKTSLIGVEKFIHLQSLCRHLSIKLIRLDSHYISSHFIINDNKTSNCLISSFSNKCFINKNRCVENTDENDLISSPLLISSSAENVNQLFMSPIIPSADVNEIQINSESTKNDNSLNGIYSFYLDDSNASSSPKSLSQSTNISTESNRSFNGEIVNKNIFRRHSTPLTNKNRRHFRDNLVKIDKSSELLSDISEETIMENVKTVKKQRTTSPRARRHHSFDSVIDGPTPSNTYNFEISSVNTDCAANYDIDNDYQYLTTMSVEVHTSTRANLNPDPHFDNIEVLFYSVINDVPVSSQKPQSVTGLIVVEHDIHDFVCDDDVTDSQSKNKYLGRCGLPAKDARIEYAANEMDLLMRFVDIVKHFDPDIIVGFDLRSYSWGFILKRADVLNINIMTPLSRINEEKYAQNAEFLINRDVPQLSGRISLNLWSIIRHECTLNMYSYENIHYHVLHERIPNYEFSTLNEWYSNYNNHMNRSRVLEYYLLRVKGCLRILDKLDFINRNSELARLFGIQFSEVFNRGSQFRVESMMLRLTKQFNYLAVSPNPKQRASMKAPEFIPLTLEPQSNYYTDPVAVLDFQSLYPSMVIAYNYCYSTCLGSVDNLICNSDNFNFGCTNLMVPKKYLIKYQNDIHISTNGVVFLKSNIRRGILPQMLEDILNTRIMVKNAIKANNKKEVPNKSLHRKLDARQLGLKLIANVTYGYTSANFSGRMPCVEIADAIVSKGRETLERAIELVNNEPKWGGKVIYGDTDSLFVLFPGCTKEEAFKRGQEIADAVTAINPKPVKLRFEKIYLPCVLQTKKRYAGFMYESVDQTLPVFDAKGIETVRRDTCPAVAKMLEKSLRILFTTNDVNAVKMYTERQFRKILEGRVSILNDFIFAREYRGKDNYSPKACVPSVDIAKKRVTSDPRNEPKVGERVPYVVVYGEPNQPIIKLVREPMELIKDPTLRLNATYYIERVIIPPLNRVFQLIGHDVMKWYNQMPRKTGINRYQYLYGKQTKSRTIPQYFHSSKCVVCANNTKGEHLCECCGKSQQNSAISICEKIRDIHNKYSAVRTVCKSCNGISDNNQLKCVSIDCPNMFRYHQSKLDLLNVSYLNDILSKF